MRVLYGVAGVGFGHSSRADVIASYLEEKGCELIILTYNQALEKLKNKFKTFKVQGPELVFEKGNLDKLKTLKKNKLLVKNLGDWRRFYSLMNEFKPDLCISDMELFVPILSHYYKIPLISIDNQHRITNLRLDIPKRYFSDYLIAKEIVNLFVRRADKFIISTFSRNKIGDSKKQNTVLVPPIIRREIIRLKRRVRRKDKILVYLSRKNKSVLDVLKGIDENFVVYGYGLRKRNVNFEFKKSETFLEDLRDCKAVIGTSGFSLISESIFLKKPYFALPLEGQFEQVLNSLFLKKSGFGDYSDCLEKQQVLNFFGKSEVYRKNLEKQTFEQEKLFRELDKIIKKYSSKS